MARIISKRSAYRDPIQKAERKIEVLQLKQGKIDQIQDNWNLILKDVPSADSILGLYNVIPGLFLGTEPILVCVSNDILFFPGSKQALRKSLDFAAGYSKNKKRILSELKADRKTFCGYQNRMSTVYSGITKEISRDYKYGPRKIECNLSGAKQAEEKSLVNRLGMNDEAFINELCDRISECGRTFITAALGLPEFGVSELTWKQRLGADVQKNYDRAKKQLGITDSSQFNGVALFAGLCGCIDDHEDSPIMLFDIFTLMYTGVLRETLTNRTEYTLFCNLLRASPVKKNDILNIVVGTSVVTPSDKGYGLLTNAYTNINSDIGEDGETQSTKCMGMKSLSYLCIAEDGKNSESVCGSFVTACVSLIRLYDENISAVYDNNEECITSITGEMGNAFEIWKQCTDIILGMMGQKLDEVYNLGGKYNIKEALEDVF